MKKWILSAAAVLMFSVAQARFEGGDFAFGVKGGWNATNISHSGLKNKMSVHLGAFAEWRINDYFGIQPELLYSRQGARNKYDNGNGEKVRYKLRVNYLDIPVLAKLYVLEGLSVDLGPQLGFALNVNEKLKSGNHTYKEKVKNFNTCDFSFAVGASYALENFILSARYNIGLTNVFGKWEKNNKNHVFQLSVGYCLNGVLGW